MIYREYELPAAARTSAICGWRFTVEEEDPEFFLHSIVPDGTANLVVAVDPEGHVHSHLVGPSTRALYTPVIRGWRYAGLRLRPWAAEAITGFAPVGLVDRTLPIEAPEPRLASVFSQLVALAHSDADWSGFGRGLVGLESAIDRAIAGAVDQLIASGGTIRISALVLESGLGERQFRRRFLRATGLSARQFASVQRVRRACILSLPDGRRWIEIAADAGYADQAHMTRAISASFGAPPRSVGGYIGRIRHEFAPAGSVRFVQDDPGAAD